MKNLLIRSLTGVVFVALILACIWLGQYTFGILFFAFMIGGVIEFLNFFEKSTTRPAKVPIFLGTIISYLLFFGASSGLIVQNYLYLLVPVFIFICIAELYRKSENPVQNLAVSILGITYVAIPFSLINLLAFPNNSAYTPSLIIGLFAIIWIYDSFAYLFGVTIGKHRLFERISPKKSWEGAIGGALSALVAAYFFADLIPQLSQWHAMTLTLLVVVFSTFGDLTESMIKRQVGLKDSSNFFPGHGGILDRFDSLLFAVPVVVFYIKVVL